MSSPAQDDADRERMYGLPRVSASWRLEEARRLEDEVIKAAQRLEHESSEFLSQTRVRLSQPRTDVRLPLAAVRPSQDKGDLEEMNRRLWAPLTPDFLPPPPPEGMGLRGLGMVAGLVGAIAVAAAIALVVANVVPIPTIGAGAHSEDSSSTSTAALENLNKVAAAQAKMQPGDSPSVPAEALLAAVPTNEIAVPKFPDPIPPPSFETAPALPTVAEPKPAAAPEPQAAVSLTRDEIASLLKRGQDLIAAGDIASARLILTHLAEAGDAEASFILAGTYDAAVSANLRGVGVQPDPAKANAWYARAAKQGSSEAARRLAQSAPR
jgi:hypothetical protein